MNVDLNYPHNNMFLTQALIIVSHCSSGLLILTLLILIKPFEIHTITCILQTNYGIERY